MLKINKYFIPYIILLLFIGYRGELLVSMVIVLFHELVHFTVAKIYGFKGFDIEFSAVGGVLKARDLNDATPREDLTISIAGPLANLIFALIFYLTYKLTAINLAFLFYKGNIAIGVFNLIPAFPLDGGRIIRDLLAFKFIFKKAQIIAIYISIFIGSVFMVLFMVLFFCGKFNFNLGIIGVFVISSSLKEKERIPYIIMGDIIKKRVKFLKRGYIENRSVSVFYKEDLLTALALCDKNKYNIFTVLDDNMKVIDIIYEEEIIEILKVHGNITIEKYLVIENEV